MVKYYVAPYAATALNSVGASYTAAGGASGILTSTLTPYTPANLFAMDAVVTGLEMHQGVDGPGIPTPGDFAKYGLKATGELLDSSGDFARSRKIFRGDDAYLGGDIGTPKVEITAVDIVNHVHPSQKGNYDSPLVSFSTRLTGPGSAPGFTKRGKTFKTTTDSVQGEIITPEIAFKIVNSDKKFRKKAGSVKKTMENNNELLINGVVPDSLIKKTN